ncbi:wall-associated receptor kinase 2-like [Mercurialis annua]|uniref:wall-associated receptor kinase 2-like n=1 Tax=Mercurialis annua TaxID=3986 RepID=UPI002160BCAC|nr:wall-associated receptor kinase 2-like [Mercurialis annua]
MSNLMQIILALSFIMMVYSLDSCPNKCGNVHVPYPFGINDTSAIIVNSACAMNESFMFLCDSTEDPPRLYFGLNLPIRDISLEKGTITIGTYESFDCYNKSGQTHHFNYWVSLGSGPFTLSDTRNKLTAVGCDTTAFMTDGVTFGSGCISLCFGNEKLDSCSGIGCCQTAVPRNLKFINITILSGSNHSGVLEYNPCGFAFIADEQTFDVSKLRLDDRPYSPSTKEYATSDVVVEWVAREETCEHAQSSSNRDRYVCGDNTYCTYSENGQGYRCSCAPGFTGNPYRPQGCQDIDECKEAVNYPCYGACKNTVGNYTCRCPLGMRGDGKIGCHGFRVTTIFTISGAFMFVMIISLLIVIIWRKRIKEKNFLENGGMLLKHQRVRLFSEKELKKATKNYDISQFLGEGGFGSVYRGSLTDGTQVAVKKPKDLDKTQINQEFQKEIGIVLQVNHVNVVKILGLCLETKHPLLVYEFISNGSLFQHIHQSRSQILSSWKVRLRIAAEIALALDYLHSLANPPIIHGDVKSANILIDENYTTKVSDFGASVLISPGQTDMAMKIQGTFGYLDPEYLMTGILTEKSDVYSFGVVLVELLTGEKPNPNARSGSNSNIIQYFLSSLERNDLSEILYLAVTEDELEDIKVFAELAKCCLSSSGMKRPSMKQVAEDLGRLRQSNESLWAQQNSLETEHLLAANTNQHDTIIMPTFDIDHYYSTASL